MRAGIVMKVVAAVLCVTVFATTTAFAESMVRCESERERYRYCSVWTDNRVTLDRQLSRTRCTFGYNWGYDRNGVWVDRGCAAEFRVGRWDSHGGGQHGGNDNRDKAAIAAGAVATVAIIAALAAKNREQEIANWAVGSFHGYDSREQVDVDLTILPGGSVEGNAGGQEFTGTLQGAKLQAGRQRFKIERAGNGFEATDENDPRHRVLFTRSGSGY